VIFVPLPNSSENKASKIELSLALFILITSKNTVELSSFEFSECKDESKAESDGPGELSELSRSCCL
jgi:hypothetical protein